MTADFILVAILSFEFYSLVNSNNHMGIHPILAYSLPGNPGMKIRLTKRGLDYANGLAAETMNKLVPKMTIGNINKDFGANGRLVFTNIRVTQFKPADSYELNLKPKADVLWKMNNMDIG